MRRFIPALVAALSLVPAGSAAAAGGNYVFAGGTAREQATVKAALDASAFDWGLVPAQITIHVGRNAATEATAGDIWLDAALVDSGIFSWGTIQHEYAHQVDFFLLDSATRQRLLGLLGGRDWCYGVTGFAHDQYGCERFASTLAWAYWPSANNTMRPGSAKDESAAMDPAKFRALLTTLVGAPKVALRSVTAYAPPKKKTSHR